MAMTFKPKKQQIHVPGHGVVQKEDFNETHFAALMKRAGSNKDAFIKQHLVVDSYGDQPLFVEAPAPVEKQKGKTGRVKQEVPMTPPGDNQVDDEAELKRLIAEEEAATGKETDSAAE